MADTVAMVMEAMLPELDDLESKGYFSRSELREVIKKRQDFEYSFKRRAALKRDFLRCIEFETKLEELRKHRKKALKIKGKRGPAETGIVRRIHFTFERATRKFKADLDLWLAWIDYCKSSNSTKQMSKVVTKALQRHGHVAALWVEAASWEFERNANVAAARALMQQGLRHCRTDEGLWGEYLRMELLYVARLRARREVLGLPNPGAVAHLVVKGAIAAVPRSLALRQRLLRVVGTFSFPGVQALRTALLEGVAADFGDREEAWDLRARSHLAAPGQASKTSADPASSGPQALTEDAPHQRCCEVFRAALAALPTPLMHMLYADYLEERLAPALQAAQMLASAVADAQGDGQAGKKGKRQSEAAAEEGMTKGPRVARTTQAAAEKSRESEQQQQQQLEGQEGGNSSNATAAAAEASMEAVSLLGAELLSVYQAAHATGKAGPEVYVRWASSAAMLAQPKLALRAVQKGCERCPSSAQVWSHRLKLELEMRGRKQHHADDLFATLETALAAVPPSDAAALWEQALQALGQHQKHQQKQQQQQQHLQKQPQPSEDLQRLQELLLRTLAASARGPVHGGMGSVVASFLRHLHAEHGPAAARALSSRLLTLPAAGGDFFRAAIELEQQELEGECTKGTKERKERERYVQRLFEAAVDAYGAEDADMWLAYTRFEASRGKGAGQLYWRATKALQDPDGFIHHFRELQGVGP
ncbi:U3 small nucleolar RNA-associated protein 6-domain-containing protein [Dunaliella salina]|uniref:U3 small nucleolar RNA-associated protein 6-domain-containing protein n=1 Tax=Dunaliella salina TaxID=3046 RepID=A0ABQ7GSM3_DUNSA|nr:U3 small nucleolar RNA-associated protein 6-domain-containing protein [Dunaliella salina]|eukprot:KAF5837621.1 U3 small nucleolar RNA-associated protein 6-domain-containing protein [Dunaliella salina]